MLHEISLPNVAVVRVTTASVSPEAHCGKSGGEGGGDEGGAEGVGEGGDEGDCDEGSEGGESGGTDTDDGEGSSGAAATVKVTLADKPELNVEHAPDRRDAPPAPAMEMEAPCHPSPNESMQLRMWLPTERQTPCV